jgi:hypothetical protein
MIGQKMSDLRNREDKNEVKKQLEPTRVPVTGLLQRPQPRPVLPHGYPFNVFRHISSKNRLSVSRAKHAMDE